MENNENHCEIKRKWNFSKEDRVKRNWGRRERRLVWTVLTNSNIFCLTFFQNSIYSWCRDHRVHHKYSETDADPVNVKRGFFFAHCGWLMCKKHPDVQKIGGKVDVSDLLNDSIVAFQKKWVSRLNQSENVPNSKCCSRSEWSDQWSEQIFRL